MSIKVKHEEDGISIKVVNPEEEADSFGSDSVDVDSNRKMNKLTGNGNGNSEWDGLD